MMQLRKAGERGQRDFGWLQANHSFSFGDYYDPEHMGFRVLRVINEDVVQAGKGFGTHPHRNMEIITCVLSGTLEHKDSLGNGSQIAADEVQRITAGRGITHSEFNPSEEEQTHLYQIWIEPDRSGREPEYEQKKLTYAEDALTLVASPAGRDGSLTIHQDVCLYRGRLSAGTRLVHPIGAGRHLWLQCITGELDCGMRIQESDGLAVSEESSLEIVAQEDVDFLLCDLP